MIQGFLFSLGTAVCKAFSDVTQKRATKHIEHDELVVLLQRTFEVPIALGVLFALWYFSITVPNLPQNPFTFVGVVLLSGGVSFMGFYCNVRALRLSDVSLVSPISQLTPAILLVTSPLMLGEAASWGGVLGVLMVVIGAYVLGIKRAHISFTALREPLIHLSSDRGVRYALLSSVFYGISSNFDKMGVTMSDPFVFLITSGTIVGIAIVLYTALTHPKRLSFSSTQIRAGFYPGISGAIGSLFQMIAISVWSVPYVIAVKRLSSVFSVLSGKLFFDESATIFRFLGALIMIVGTGIIVLFG